MRTKIAAGNWKMNGLRGSLTELLLIASTEVEQAEIIIFPPMTLLAEAASAVQGTRTKIGAQNCHQAVNGAYTGEVSAEMIENIGATHVIIGHSERRALYGESDEIVKAKAAAAHSAGLTAIICIGESLEMRQAGEADHFCAAQLLASLPEGASASNTIIAYEPIWAIGTGLVPSNADIAQMHARLRENLPDAEAMRILYGGSVKPSNAAEIFAVDNVDGGLVGGASLKAEDFSAIIRAAETAMG